MVYVVTLLHLLHYLLQVSPLKPYLVHKKRALNFLSALQILVDTQTLIFKNHYFLNIDLVIP